MTSVERDQCEHWRDIPRHPGYQASDHGRVRSLDRVVEYRDGRRHHYRGKVLAPSRSDRAGRQVVNLPSGTRLVHQLVLEAFVGPRPPGLQACHANDDPADNRLANLRWDTPSANRQDATRNGRDHQANKTHCPLGHLLVAPNLVPSKRLTQRDCLACDRARGNRRANADLPLLLLADIHYGLLHARAGLALPEIDYNRGKAA